MAEGIDVGSFTGSTFKGEDAIQKIMAAQRKKKIPLENEKFRLQMIKEAWLGLQIKLADLNMASREFYSPAYSPFRETITSSSDPNILEILNKETDPTKLTPGKYSITPKQMAQNDHFKSDPLETEKLLPASQFTLIYKGKNFPISFPGGNIKALIDLINTNASDFLTASGIEIDGKTLINIEGKEIGKKSKIDFSGDVSFLKSLGLIKNAPPSYYNTEINQPDGLSGSKEIPDLLMNQTLNLDKKDYATKVLPLVQEIESETQLWIYLKHTFNRNEGKNEKQKEQSKKEEDSTITGFLDKLWVGDAQLTGGDLFTSLDSIVKELEQNKPQQIEDPTNSAPDDPGALLSLVLEYEDTSKIPIKSYFQKDSDALQVIKINIPKGKLTSIQLKNDSLFDLKIDKAELITLNKGKYDSKNPIKKAQNALLNYQGIDYERDTNTIKDIIPATIMIKGESLNPISVGIDFDYDSILEKLKEWVIAYNNCMDYIKNVKTEDSNLFNTMNRDRAKELQEKKDRYEKYSQEDKEKLSIDGRLFSGVLNTDRSLDMVKEKLQEYTTRPYDTDAKEKIMFLYQLGVSKPNASQLASLSDRDRDNYRAGYLDFTKESQKQFLAILREFFTPTQQFFFKRNTPESKAYDAGMFINFNEGLELFLKKSVNKLPGFFSSKVEMINSQMKAQDKKIEDLENRMKIEEDKLRRDFGKVYEAQGRAKSMDSQLNRFSK